MLYFYNPVENYLDEYAQNLLHALQERYLITKVNYLTEAIIASDDVIILFGVNNPEVPLPKRFIAVQLEQWGKRWFTEEYLSRLRKAEEVWELSQSNVARLNALGIKTRYLPLGRIHAYPLLTKTPEEYDVFFYGTPHPHRYQILKDLLDKGLNVAYAMEAFGKEREVIIEHSKLILNLHYYPEASVEQLRIYSALSKGKLVISEPSQDPLPIALYTEQIYETCVEWLHKSKEEREQKAVELYQNFPLMRDLLPDLTALTQA